MHRESGANTHTYLDVNVEACIMDEMLEDVVVSNFVDDLHSKKKNNSVASREESEAIKDVDKTTVV